MPEDTIIEDTTTNIPQEAVVLTQAQPRKRTPRGQKKAIKTNRQPEDCYLSDPKKMSDKERIDVILFFQASIEEIQAKYKTLDSNTQGAFAQARQLQDKNASIDREARTKMNLLKQNISILYQNSLLIEMDGDR